MNPLLPLLAVAATAVLCGPAAASLPFQAAVTATSRIVEVVDPVEPRVRFESDGSAVTSLGDASYWSTDVLSMATGQGQGINRFTFASGDELHGQFDIQAVPTASPGLFDLFGTLQIAGGTGTFAGATGTAAFTGWAQFVSDTEAQLGLQFDGHLQPVPEPTATLLLLAGLGALAWRGRRAR